MNTRRALVQAFIKTIYTGATLILVLKQTYDRKVTSNFHFDADNFHELLKRQLH